MASRPSTDTVADLVASFAAAEPDELDAAFHRLAGILWTDGRLTSPTLAEGPVLITALDRLGERHQGRLAVLLGLLAEAEYPRLDGPAATAVRAGLDRYLDLLRGAEYPRPLSLAMLYLVAHFPADRERILAVTGDLPLDEHDRSRMDRSLSVLDPGAPDIGRVWPAPVVWQLDEKERAFDRAFVAGLTPEQVTANWVNDTRTVLGFTGARAWWAVRNGDLAPIDTIAAGPVPDSARTEPGTGLFARHAGALRCPSCSGPLEFRPGSVRCDACATVFPVANGVLNLTGGVSEAAAPSDDTTADLLAKLAEMPSMGLYYETVLRPAYLQIAGSNWGGAVSIDDEYAYLRTHINPVNGPVLDLAAGAGNWTTVIAGTVGAERLLALDMGLSMLSVLRGRLPEVPAVQASALDLPIADESLGAVICWNALQAFPDDAATAIAEVGRCLRPGGTFTLMTFVWDNDPVQRHFQASHHFPSRPEGMLLFETEELVKWLADAGMTVREQSGPGAFIFLTAEKALTAEKTR